MSSANVDKALQLRPPIAMYSLECTADVNVFFIPGDPMGITGTPSPANNDQGAHTMLTNFISIQSIGAPVLNGAWVRFWGSATEPVTPQGALDPGWIDPTSVTTLPGPNPEPDPIAPLYIPGGATVRFDLSELFVHGAGPERTPIQYMSYTQNTGPSALRVWRSSGR